MSVAARLQIFVDAGLLARAPTRRQLLHGELEMTPYVISTDATDEEGYRDTLAAHPLVRQLRIFSHVGLDHVRTGSALGAKLESLCAHLIVTFHRGMPVFDLQVIQTHPHGLDRLRAAIAEVLAGGSRRARIADALIADLPTYLGGFLGEDGYIARAARFDYAPPSDGAFPPEFWSLVGLADYCAHTFPDALPRPREAVTRLTRRFREVGGFGWFRREPSRASAR